MVPALNVDKHVSIALDIIEIVVLAVNLNDCWLSELDVHIDLLSLVIQADIRCILVTVMVHLIQLIVLILLYLNILLPIVLVDGIKVLVHLWCHVRFLFEVAWVLEVLPLFRLLLHHSQLLFGRWISLWGDWRQWLGSDEIFRLGYRSHCRSPCHVFDLWIRRVFFC